MNRRQFIIGSFMAGGLAAVGIRPKPVQPLTLFAGMKPAEWAENEYFKCSAFKMREPHTVYFVGQSVSCPDVNRLKIEGDVELTIIMRPAPSC